MKSSTLYTCPSSKIFWILALYRVKSSVGVLRYFFSIILVFWNKLMYRYQGQVVRCQVQVTLVLHSPLPQFGPIRRKKSLSGRHFFLLIVTAKIKPVLKHTSTEPSEKGGPSWKTSYKPPPKKIFPKDKILKIKKKHV